MILKKIVFHYVKYIHVFFFSFNFLDKYSLVMELIVLAETIVVESDYKRYYKLS